jgi:hypothetical protein
MMVKLSTAALKGMNAPSTTKQPEFRSGKNQT